MKRDPWHTYCEAFRECFPGGGPVLLSPAALDHFYRKVMELECTPRPEGTLRISLTDDQREDIICNLQHVRLTDWSTDLLTGYPCELREVSASDMLDCVLNYLNKPAPPQQRSGS